MKEVNIHYFVPENAKELEGLVGKPVGVKISSANPAEPMVFMGAFTEDIYSQYEFIRQSVDASDGRDIPLRKVLGFRRLPDFTEFQKDGVKISGFHTVQYKPETFEYEAKLQSLKNNNLWRESK